MIVYIVKKFQVKFNIFVKFLLYFSLYCFRCDYYIVMKSGSSNYYCVHFSYKKLSVQSNYYSLIVVQYLPM